MANLCTTEITFYTDLSNINELEKLFKILTRVNNDESYDEEAVSKELGFEMHNELTFGYLFAYIDEDISTNYDISYFQITRDSKWSPKIEIFDEILKSFKNIEYVYLAEEPGCEIYINTDTGHLFYSSQYKIQVSEFSDYFTGLTNSALNHLGLNSAALKDFEDYSENYCDEESLLENGNQLFSREFRSFHELKNYAESLSKFIDTYIGVFEYDSEQ